MDRRWEWVLVAALVGCGDSTAADTDTDGGDTEDARTTTGDEMMTMGPTSAGTMSGSVGTTTDDSSAATGSETSMTGVDGSSSSGEPGFSVGGVVTGLNGSITLQNNGGDDITLDADGPFTFATSLLEGETYAVTASDVPSVQQCSIDRADGEVAGDVDDVLVRCGNLALFEARGPQGGLEPWISDGSDVGTVALGDLNEGAGSSNPAFVAGLGGRLIFRARTNATGFELWSTDGSAEDTVMLEELEPGVLDANFVAAGVLGGLLYVQFQGALWVSDGQPGGVMELFFDPDPSSAAVVTGAAVADDYLVFAAQSEGDREPWVTDGTEDGTVLLGDLNSLGDSNPEFFGRAIDGLVYFTADTADGRELWVTDGTPGGTEQVIDLQPGVLSSNPTLSGALGGRVLFGANVPAEGAEPFISDGTEVGTVSLGYLNPTVLGSEPLGFTTLGDVAVFRADDGVAGRELWRTDGTEVGTEMVVDLYPGPIDGFGDGVFVHAANPSPDADPWAVFAANDGVAGNEAWVTDGTEEGTVQLVDISPGAPGGNPSRFVTVGPDRVLFFGNVPGEGCEPYISDGTARGTEALSPLNPGPGDGC
ncbi:MAG: hypothetical protein ACE37F_16705 [Nannocystaceae bacterium]|nr:hypothetical protein [bacterium]